MRDAQACAVLAQSICLGIEDESEASLQKRPSSDQDPNTPTLKLLTSRHFDQVRRSDDELPDFWVDSEGQTGGFGLEGQEELLLHHQLSRCNTITFVPFISYENLIHDGQAGPDDGAAEEGEHC